MDFLAPAQLPTRLASGDLVPTTVDAQPSAALGQEEIWASAAEPDWLSHAAATLQPEQGHYNSQVALSTCFDHPHTEQSLTKQQAQQEQPRQQQAYQNLEQQIQQFWARQQDSQHLQARQQWSPQKQARQSEAQETLPFQLSQEGRQPSPFQLSRAPSREPSTLLSQSSSEELQHSNGHLHVASDPGPPLAIYTDKATEKTRARDRNRDAQRRFRQRQREQAACSMRLVADMTARLEAMALRQSELQLRNQVLEHTVRLSSRHVQQLGLAQTGVGGPELDRKQQQLLMLESTHVWSRVMGKSLSDYTLDYCCEMPFGFFMDEEFPALIHRLRSLLDTGGWDAETPAGQELKTIVTLRHKEEYRNALFSRWFVALAAWNEEIMRDPAVSPPPASFWEKVLAGLRLQASQATEMVIARHVLLRRIIDIRQMRAQLVLALGTSALDPDSGMDSSTGVKRLHASMEEEREAVLDFLYKVIDDCLTPAQEAYLDTQSCPWWPDLWHMTGLLAWKQPASGSKKLPLETSVPAATAPPQHAMFELLRRPQLALGQGLILKRGLAAVPIAEDALWSVCPPMPSIALLRGMSSLDVMCGAFWDTATQQKHPLPAKASKLPDVKRLTQQQLLKRETQA